MLVATMAGGLSRSSPRERVGERSAAHERQRAPGPDGRARVALPGTHTRVDARAALLACAGRARDGGDRDRDAAGAADVDDRAPLADHAAVRRSGDGRESVAALRQIPERGRGRVAGGEDDARDRAGQRDAPRELGRVGAGRVRGRRRSRTRRCSPRASSAPRGRTRDAPGPVLQAGAKKTAGEARRPGRRRGRERRAPPGSWHRFADHRDLVCDDDGADRLVRRRVVRDELDLVRPERRPDA